MSVTYAETEPAPEEPAPEGPAVAPETEASTRPPRIDSLTGLRIFAAGVVYLSHLGAPKGGPEWLGTMMTSGYSGVTLFFVLSGFVLALNYFDEMRAPSGRKLWRFAVARVARIYPIYLLTVGYAVLATAVSGQDTSAWPAHLLAIQAWNPDGLFATALNGPAWSISVEFFLYACFPLVVLALARIRRTRTLCIVGITAVLVMVGLAAWFAARETGVETGGFSLDPGASHRWLYRNPLARLGDFILGVVAARLFVTAWSARQRSRRAQMWMGWMAPLAALAFLGVMAYKPLVYTPWAWDVAYAVPAVLLIFGLAAAPQTRLSRFLSRPTVVFLGAASYSFYMIHALLMGKVGAGLWTSQMSVMTVLFEIASFGIVLAAAAGLYVLVEDPARKRIQRLGGMRRPRRRSAPAPVVVETPQEVNR